MLLRRVLLSAALSSFAYISDGQEPSPSPGSTCPTSGSCVFSAEDENGVALDFDFTELTPKDEGYGCEGHKITDDLHNYEYYVGVCGNNAKECGVSEVASVTQYYNSGGWSFCEGILAKWAEGDIATELIRVGPDADGNMVTMGMRMTFVNGEACWTPDGDQQRTTVMEFVCDETTKENDPPMGPVSGGEDENEDCKYTFTIPTYLACPAAGGGDELSIGSILLILGFFVFIPVYCLGGFLYNKYKLDKSGADAIPQWQFWSHDLWAFTKAGCAATGSCLCGLCGGGGSKNRASSADEL